MSPNGNRLRSKLAVKAECLLHVRAFEELHERPQVKRQVWPEMPPPIVVVGMHRSGTSITTKALGAMGLDLGKRLSPELSENLHVTRLNDMLLGHLGGSWDRPPRSGHRFFRAGQLANWYRKWTIRCHAGSWWPTRPMSVWGWKDPRNSLLLDVILLAFPKATVVWVRRDSEAAARSLWDREKRRYGRGGSPVCQTLTACRALAKYYDQTIENGIAGHPASQVIRTDFPGVFESEACLETLGRVCGLELASEAMLKVLQDFDLGRARRHGIRPGSD